jgi:Ca-activated chloride channel family protein
MSLVPPLAAADDAASTPGALRVSRENGVLVEMPLRHTKVSIEVTAFVARSTIEQVFANPFTDPVEAVYTFPLGDRAAVDDFELVVGDRTIKGTIKRREEARATYEQARAAGYQAALLEQERPNIFTQSVANLEPGKAITVRLRTVETLRYERGVYRLTFPLVVGPRYVPGGSVADAARISPPVHAPGTRSGHDVEIAVTIDAGVPLTRLESPSHRTITNKTAASGATVRLADDDAIPNKDFLLRWSVGSEKPALGLLAHRDGLDGFFTLLVQPKGDVGPTEAMPKEITFVVDTSGSMRGIPIEASKRFAAKALQALGPRDTFNLVRFAGDNEVYSKDPLPNDRASVASAIAWLNRHQGGGGTELLAAMKAAFARPADPNRLRVVVFLTDGYVGNDAEILSAIGKILGDARIYTVGIGSSVNHYLLDRMADLGRGAYVFVRPDESADDALEAFRSWVTLPYLTDLSIDWGALPVADLNPERIPDLGSGQTLTVVGRFLSAGEGDVVVRGKIGGRYFQQSLHVALPERETRNAALSSLWARGRIEELLQASGKPTPDSVTAEVTALALTYRLMSPYTSFVAVDDSRVVNLTGTSRTVHQALPPPEGVPLAGIFGKEGPEGLQKAEEPEDGADGANETVNGGVTGGVVGGVAGGVVGGIPNTDPLTGQFLGLVTSDSIEELTVVTAGAGAEFGRAQGGFASVVAAPEAAPPTTTTFSSEFVSDLTVAGRKATIDLDDNQRKTKFAADFIADLPVAGRFYQRTIPLSNKDGNPNVPGARGRKFKAKLGGIESVPERSSDRLLDVAFRLLADLADDGKLSAAEGRPALAALLAAQRGSGAIASDVAVHAIATWALAEAAVVLTDDPWVVAARTKAVDYLSGLAQPDGWPARTGEAVDAEATRWARLVLGAIKAASVASIPVPKGEPSKRYVQLRASLAAAKSGAAPPVVTGRLPFERLVRSIGRRHLKVVGV